jgi:hypothetical protein
VIWPAYREDRFEESLDLVIVTIQEVRGRNEEVVAWESAVAADGDQKPCSVSTKHCNGIWVCEATVSIYPQLLV